MCVQNVSEIWEGWASVGLGGWLHRHMTTLALLWHHTQDSYITSSRSAYSCWPQCACATTQPPSSPPTLYTHITHQHHHIQGLRWRTERGEGSVGGNKSKDIEHLVLRSSLMLELTRRIKVRHQKKGGLYRVLRCSVLLIGSRTKRLYICVTGNHKNCECSSAGGQSATRATANKS